MNRPMVKSEVQAWRTSWSLVSEREREELRNESPAEKFRALAFLMASIDLFDLSSLDAEDAAARRRWAHLQSLAGND